MTQIAVEYDGVDGGDKKFAKKLSTSWRIVKKSKKPQRPEKSAKAIGLKELSFLTFHARLAFTKMGFRYIELTTVSFWSSLEVFKNCKL